MNMVGFKINFLVLFMVLLMMGASLGAVPCLPSALRSRYIPDMRCF